MDSLTYSAWPTDQIHAYSSDLPELYYDQTWPSPTSATSSNYVSTPPTDFQPQMSWLEDISTKYYPPSEWHESSSTRPSIAPIDTNWKQFNPHRAPEQPSILFTPLENFDATILQSLSQQTSSFPQSSQPETAPNFRFSAAASSPVPTNNISQGALAPRKPKRTRSPGSQIHHPAGLKIHHPRPSRQIPIISLSRLAAACDNFPIQSRAKKSKSGNLNTRSSLSSTSHPSYNHHSLHAQIVQTEMFNLHAKSNACRCGCMQ